MFHHSIDAQFLQLSKTKESVLTKHIHTLFHLDSTTYYVLRFDKSTSKAEIELYNKDLSFKKSYLIGDGGRKYIGVINIHSNKYLLYFNYIKNNRENIHESVSLYAKRVNDQFELEKDSIALIEPFTMVSNYYRGNFSISPDKSKILVYDYEEDGDIDDVQGLTNEINLRIFDKKLNKLWSRKVNLSPDGSTKRKVAVKKLRVNNEGEVSILTDIFKNVRSYNLKYITAEPTLFFVGRKSEEFMMFRPNLGDYFFNQIDFCYDDVGNIIWFGFYSKEKYYQQKGVFYIKINQNRTKILCKQLTELSPLLISKMLHRKKIKNNAEARSYKIVNWHLTEKNELLLSAEMRPQTGYNFRSDDIIALKFDQTGQLIWQEHIFKTGNLARRQKVFLSHYMFTKNDHTYILFNTGIYENDVAKIVRIAPDGTMKLKKWYRYMQSQVLFCPVLSYFLPDEKLFLCFQDRFFSAYKYGLLDVEALFKDNPD